MVNIQHLTSLEGDSAKLAELLINTVDSNASIGFTAPVLQATAVAYWVDVAAQIAAGEKHLIAAFCNEQLVGAVQLSLCTKENGRHRAEIEKLMVHSDYRQQGIAQQLVRAAESLAVSEHISLLVLDTRAGDKAEPLYHKLGYVEAGKIPHFTQNQTGVFEATVIFYKQLTPELCAV